MSSISPGMGAIRTPTTVTRSRRPRTFTFAIVKPFLYLGTYQLTSISTTVTPNRAAARLRPEPNPVCNI
jgi:hypothetical protein